MWLFKKKIGRRRQELRRNMPASGPGLWQRICHAGGGWGVVLALALWAGAVALDVWPVDPLPYRAGQYVVDDVHSRVAFEVYAYQRHEELRAKARNSVPSHYRLNEALVRRVLDALAALPERCKALAAPADADAALKAQLGLTDQNAPAVLAAWTAYGEGEKREQLKTLVEALDRDLIDTETYGSPDKGDGETSPIGKEVVMVSSDPKGGPDVLRTRRSRWMISLADEPKLVRERIDVLAGAFPEDIRPGVVTCLASMLTREAMYTTDKAALADAKRLADATAKANRPHDTYAVGDLLVRASWRRTEGHSPGLTGSELTLLETEHNAFAGGIAREDRKRDGIDPLWFTARRIGGRACTVALAVLLLCFYICFYEKRIARNPWRGVAVVTTLLAMLAATKVLVNIGWANPLVCILPVLVATIIMTIAYNRRFALGLGAIMAAMIVLQLRADFGTFVLVLVPVSATVLQLDEIRTRNKLIGALSVAAVLVFLATWGMGLFAAVPVDFILSDSLWAAVSAVLAGLVAQAILPIIERVFRIATSMTLLEWCDASRPLMRRLAMESPGTHNHSLQLGSMCEAAADCIGARGLLARVGAYYHDIGKINKPEYFSENESGSASKHAKLSPAMSLLIIIGHVKDGVEMAREYGLPPVLHEFIATHHGTTLVQYFYHAAAEQRKSDSDRAPDEVEFRYPGPKPRSKETGILMLADAAESSVRAMAEPTPGRIENQVHAMVSRRLMDGQLDDCDLTLREVHLIETSLIKSLCGVYHSRIAYPTPAGEKPSAAELHPKQGNGKGNGNGSGESKGDAEEKDDKANGIKAREITPPVADDDVSEATSHDAPDTDTAPVPAVTDTAQTSSP